MTRLAGPLWVRLAVTALILLYFAWDIDLRAASLAIADGSALLFVGLPGLAAWLVWLLATGVRLVRARTADCPDNAGSASRTISSRNTSS